jgi:hypothetical protein
MENMNGDCGKSNVCQFAMKITTVNEIMRKINDNRNICDEL